MKSLWMAVAAPTMAVAMPAAAQTEITNPAGAWVHPTGVSFPAQSGTAVRNSITQFDDEGRDVGVTYHLRSGSTPIGLTTIYVYPMPDGGCEGSWNAEKAELGNNGGGVLSEDRAPSPSGRTRGAASHARVKMAIGGDSAVSSSMYLYCVPGGKWLVKYYASWRGTADQDGQVIAILQSMTWPGEFNR